MLDLRHRCGNVLGWPKPNIASKNASREARVKPGWRTMRCVTGRVGSIIKRLRYWPRGSWFGKPSGGKKWTPAIQYLRQLGSVDCMVHAAKCSHLSNGLINKNRLWHFRKQF